MALTVDLLKFLLYARAQGASFERTATLGRQQCFLLDGRAAERQFELFGDPLEPGEGRRLIDAGGGYAEELLKRLGAERVAAVDYSDYEGADVLHDMNLPVPDELLGRFSLVLDGGALEHIFDVPQALRNLMAMTAEGGHLVIASPANNWFGHGFYQFSPELFQRTLVAGNGFELRSLVLHTWRRPDRWFDLADAAERGHRATLVNAAPAELFVCARKTQHVELEDLHPQESEYERLWSEYEAGVARRDGVPRIAAALFDRAPLWVYATAIRHRMRWSRIYDRGALRRVNLVDAARPGSSQG